MDFNTATSHIISPHHSHHKVFTSLTSHVTHISQWSHLTMLTSLTKHITSLVPLVTPIIITRITYHLTPTSRVTHITTHIAHISHRSHLTSLITHITWHPHHLSLTSQDTHMTNQLRRPHLTSFTLLTSDITHIWHHSHHSHLTPLTSLLVGISVAVAVKKSLLVPTADFGDVWVSLFVGGAKFVVGASLFVAGVWCCSATFCGGLTYLAMLERGFSWQAEHLVMLECHFSWSWLYLLMSTWLGTPLFVAGVIWRCRSFTFLAFGDVGASLFVAGALFGAICRGSGKISWHHMTWRGITWNDISQVTTLIHLTSPHN